jgi:hypothetical protein
VSSAHSNNRGAHERMRATMTLFFFFMVFCVC